MNPPRTTAVAVIVTGLIAFACSIVWYSPLLFGSIWMEYRGAAVSTTPGWTFAFAPLREIFTACLLAWLIGRLAVRDWRSALALGLTLWAAFYLVQLAGAVIWDKMPWQLGAVHAGDWLIKMLLMSTILTLWLRQRTSRLHASAGASA